MVKLSDIRMRDPFVLPVSGEKMYYLFGTTDQTPWEGVGIGFDAYRSTDLENWEGPFAAFRPPEGFWADQNFWAPEVHCWDGRYFMFASFKAEGRERATQVLLADSPLGPYLPHTAGPITPKGWECLDGSLYVEAGVPWLVFCREWLQVGDGEIHALPLTQDLTEAAGEARLLFRASAAPWTKAFDHNGKTCRVTDGPFLFRDGSTLKMLWSSHGDQGYAMGVAISDTGSILGPWTQQKEPVFSQDGGHGMLFDTWDGQKLMSVHQPNTTPLERPRFFHWKDVVRKLSVIPLPMSPNPPLGWNSWDCYGAAVREEEVLANAEYMSKYLLPFGWNTVVVDIQWAEPTADSSRYHSYAPLTVDDFSRLTPAENRFPSAADGKGFTQLGEKIHALGLRFGIHIMRGIPRQAVHQNTPIERSSCRAREVAHPNSICPWNTDMYGLDPTHPGAQDYYDSLFRLYAAWGVDFVKIDDIAASRLYGPHIDELAVVHRALRKCGRPILLSLSPGPASVELAHAYSRYAQMWRITDDFWDNWNLLKDMFDRCERWYAHVGPDSWPDCDMLPLGHIGIRSVDGGGANRFTRFTRDEQRTLMTLWCIFRSPLMFGGELRDNDDWTNSLLTNREVLAVNQYGQAPEPVTVGGELRIWKSHAPDGCLNVALFNLSDAEVRMGVFWDELGLNGPRAVRDLWDGESLGTFEEGYFAKIFPHGSRLLRIEG